MGIQPCARRMFNIQFIRFKMWNPGKPATRKHFGGKRFCLNEKIVKSPSKSTMV